MMEDQIVSYALENSFPIAVTVFLLWKDTKVNTKVTESLNEVSQTLAIICEKLK